MASITKEDIKEAIKSMTILEVSELVKDLEEEFGISATAPMMVAGAMPAAAGAATAEVEQTEFKLVLKQAGSSKIPLIKEIRALTSLGLKEAKALVDSGGVVKDMLSKEEAEKLKKSFTDLGATVELE